MAATPNSSASSYATPADFIQRYDVRHLGDLVGDTGSRVDPVSILTNPNLQAALDDASGEIEAACLVAGRYQPADLQALTGVGLALLRSLTCRLAYWRLRVRRKPDSELTEDARGALELLDRLRLGERIFPFTETQEAGNVDTDEMGPSDIGTLWLSSTAAERYFGVRRRSIW